MQVSSELARSVIRAAWQARGRRDPTPEGELAREVHVTPYLGDYGPAGAVLTVNGSPVRLTAMVSAPPYELQWRPYDVAVWVFDAGRPRRITDSGPKRLLPLRRAILQAVTATMLEAPEAQDYRLWWSETEPMPAQGEGGA